MSFPKVFQILCWDFWETGAVDFQNAGFWRLKAPETRIWAPDGAFGPKRQIFYIFSLFLVSFFWIFRVWGAANKSTASAASPDYVKFQAVIKSAASAASRKPKIKETKIQGSAPFRRPTVPRRPAVPVVPPSPVARALPWILVPLIWSQGRLR